MFHGSLPEASNREDYEYIAQIVDSDTDDLIDLSAATIVAQISDQDGCQKILLGTATGEITLPDVDTFRILIPRASMACLCAGQYRVGLTVENAGLTTSFIIGTLPVLDGNVPR